MPVRLDGRIKNVRVPVVADGPPGYRSSAADLGGPLARAHPSTTDAAVGERIEFDAEGATDEGRWIDSLEWSFGDGTTAEGWWAAHSYDEAGEYAVESTATDDTGYSTTHTVTVTVG